MNTRFAPLFALVSILLTSFTNLAQDGFPDTFITSGAGANWNDPASWASQNGIDDGINPGSDGIPDGDDEIFILHSLTVASNQEYGFLEVNNDGGGTFVTLTVNAGDTLTAINTLHSGVFTVFSSNFSTKYARAFVSGVIYSYGVGVTSGGTGGRARLRPLDGAEIHIDGDLSFVASSQANSLLNLAVNSSSTPNKVFLSGSIAGDGKISGGSGTASRFILEGTSAQVIPLNTGINAIFGSIEISNPVSVTTDASFSTTNLLGNFTVTSGGKFNQGAIRHVFGDTVANHGAYTFNDSIEFESSFTNTGTFTSSGGRINIAGDWTNSGTYTYSAGDTVTFDGSTAQTITGSSTFSVLELSNTGAAAPPYNVTFASGSIEIDSIFDINDCDVENAAATITLTSTDSRTAQMLDIGTGSYRGDMVVQRHLDCTTNNWRELISPVMNTDISQWQNDGVTMTNFPGSDYPSFGWTSVYWYDENAVTTSITDGWTAPDSTDLESDIDRGIRLYMGNSTFDLSVTGEPRTGNQQIAVTNGDPTNTTPTFGWNLVGNPYPCAVNWNLLVEADKNNIDDGIWAWNGTDGNYDFYAPDSVVLGDLDSIIPSHKAFWVHAAAVSGYIDWNEHDKVTAENNFVKSSTILPGKSIVVRMTSDLNTYRDAAMLKIGRSSTMNYDRNQDFLKMYSNMIDEVPSLCFVTEDDNDVCVNSVPNTTTNVPLKAFAGSLALGTYTLTFENVESFAKNACITLEDLVLGTTQDLKANPQYTYEALAGDESINRFMIHIEVQYDVTADGASCQGLADGTIEVVHNTQSIFSISWSDELGNVIGSDFSNSSNYVIPDLSPGLYNVDISGNCSLDELAVAVVEPEPVVADFNVGSGTIHVNDVFTVANNSSGSSQYYWEMGDGSEYNDFMPSHFYNTPGTYSIELTSFNESKDCNDRKKLKVEIVESIVSIDTETPGSLSAVAANGTIYLRNTDKTYIESIQLVDLNGKLLISRSINGATDVQVKIPSLSQGVYMLNASTEDGVKAFKLFLD